MFKVVDVSEAVSCIKDGDTVAIGGAGAGHAGPDRLLQGLGERYVKTAEPKNITVLHPCGIGDNVSRGMNHVAYEGLIDTTIGGFWGNAPKMVQLALDNKIKGYNFPQGVLGHLVRATASGKPGVVTHIGLNTYVDPRLEGGKLNDITTEDLVEVIEIGGKEYLFYKAMPVDVAFIRGILCNWLVCLAIFMAVASRDISGKILACYVPIMAFVTSGFFELRVYIFYFSFCIGN